MQVADDTLLSPICTLLGEVGIDNGLVVQAKEEIVEMNNGCICCTGKTAESSSTF